MAAVCRAAKFVLRRVRLQVAPLFRVGSIRIAACDMSAAAAEEWDVMREEGTKRGEADTDDADINFDYGPETGVDVVWRESC
jgi:hypothetical protein